MSISTVGQLTLTTNEIHWPFKIHYQLTSTDQTSYHLPPLPPFLPMHGWILIVDEYGAQLKLMDAICLGKQSCLHQYFWSLLFSLSLSVPLKRKVS